MGRHKTEIKSSLKSMVLDCGYALGDTVNGQ